MRGLQESDLENNALTAIGLAPKISPQEHFSLLLS